MALVLFMAEFSVKLSEIWYAQKLFVFLNIIFSVFAMYYYKEAVSFQALINNSFVRLKRKTSLAYYRWFYGWLWPFSSITQSTGTTLERDQLKTLFCWIWLLLITAWTWQWQQKQGSSLSKMTSARHCSIARKRGKASWWPTKSQLLSNLVVLRSVMVRGSIHLQPRFPICQSRTLTWTRTSLYQMQKQWIWDLRSQMISTWRCKM